MMRFTICLLVICVMLGCVGGNQGALSLTVALDGDGHALPIHDKDGNVVDYAMNTRSFDQSQTAKFGGSADELETALSVDFVSPDGLGLKLEAGNAASGVLAGDIPAIVGSLGDTIKEINNLAALVFGVPVSMP